MSGQGPQTTHKVRRNVSPSQTQRQGPIKAVKPFGINLRNSPSRSPSSPSHVLFTQQGPRRSPVAESRHSPDRRSPGPGSPSKGKNSFLCVWQVAIHCESETRDRQSCKGVSLTDRSNR